MNLISEILKQHGIKSSFQRIKIYQYLSTHFIHPTADQVYEALKNEMTTLSKSTVYSTLKTFISHNLIREITIDENEIRYEFNLKDHGHFKCEECDSIYDFNASIRLFPNELDNFKITDKNIYFKGICKSCV